MQLEKGLLQIEVTPLLSSGDSSPVMEFGLRKYMVSVVALHHRLASGINRYTIAVSSGMYCYDLLNRAAIPVNADIGDMHQNSQNVHLRMVWSPKQ